MSIESALPATLGTAPVQAERSDRLRLLYVINGLGTGGAERSLAELLPFLQEADIQPTIAVLYPRQEGVEATVREQGYDVRLLPRGGWLSRVRALREIITRERIELIHTTIFDADLLGRLAAVRSGVPVLSSLVNVAYDQVRLQDPNVRRGRLWAVRQVDGWTARYLTTHFHAVAAAVKDSYVQALRLRPERITVIERGRNPERLGTPGPNRRVASRRRLGLDPEEEVIITVGRQEFQKGHRYLLEAMELLGRSRSRLTLLLAGRRGHASEELDRLREASGSGDRIRFLGHRGDVPELLAAADLFVFPSLYEGIGGSLIEALALGLPIVASDLPSIREVVEPDRSGLLIEPASPAALASAITELLGDRRRAEAFGKRSLEIFRERFVLERSAARMIQLYRQLAGRDGRQV